MTLPAAFRAHLDSPTLAGFWMALRARLERTGHAVRGSIRFALDHDAADRLSGLLGRPVTPDSRVALAELDAALRSSAAGRGLVAVVAELTGAPLRDRPAERATRDLDWAATWSALDDALAAAGLASDPWVAPWVAWLHGGVITRLGPQPAATRLRTAVSVLGALNLADSAHPRASPSPARTSLERHDGHAVAQVPTRRPAPPAGDTTDSQAFDDNAIAEPPPGQLPDRTHGVNLSPTPDSLSTRTLGQLAGTTTGSAHGLDDGRTVPALVLRAASIALDLPPPATAAERRELWRRLGVEPDAVSGTVLVWALRPPGADPWSAMMRTRAELGLVTHLTMRELRTHDVALTEHVVHACENPQVLQHLADTGTGRPLACFSGNPAAAATLFVERASVRYHGDFDWPGVAIARRVLAAGAEPWLFTAADYLDAVEHLPTDHRLALTGTPEATPWDPALREVMLATNAAVHEEAILDQLAESLD